MKLFANQKGVIVTPLLTTVIVLAGIVLAVLLLRNPAIFNPKAFTQMPSSSSEAGLNEVVNESDESSLTYRALSQAPEGCMDDNNNPKFLSWDEVCSVAGSNAYSYRKSGQMNRSCCDLSFENMRCVSYNSPDKNQSHVYPNNDSRCGFRVATKENDKWVTGSKWGQFCYENTDCQIDTNLPVSAFEADSSQQRLFGCKAPTKEILEKPNTNSPIQLKDEDIKYALEKGIGRCMYVYPAVDSGNADKNKCLYNEECLSQKCENGYCKQVQAASSNAGATSDLGPSSSDRAIWVEQDDGGQMKHLKYLPKNKDLVLRWQNLNGLTDSAYYVIVTKDQSAIHTDGVTTYTYLRNCAPTFNDNRGFNKCNFKAPDSLKSNDTILIRIYMQRYWVYGYSDSYISAEYTIY